MVPIIASIYNSRLTLSLALLALFAACFGWIFPASMIGFHPGAVDISNNTVTLARTFPGDRFGLPRPVMSYKEVVRPLTPLHNGGHPCVQTAGPLRYISPAPVGTWSLDWAGECTDDPAGYFWEAAWTMHIGALTLGPVRASHTVLQPQEGTTP